MEHKKQTKSKTLLTGNTYAPPDRPDLKAMNIKADMFCSKTVSNAVRVLLTDLFYWVENQLKYPEEAAGVAQAVRYHLTRLADKNPEIILPPIPSSITGLMRWVLFVESYFINQSIKDEWEATVEAVCRSVKKYMTVKQVIPIAEKIITKNRHLTQSKLRELAGGCSKNTLSKAIRLSPTLKKYFGIKTPKAVELTDEIIDTFPAPEQPEPPPDDAESDKILAALVEHIAEVKPEIYDKTVKELEKMEPEKRQKFAQLCEEERMHIKTEKTQTQFKAV